MAEIEVKHVSKVFQIDGKDFKALDDVSLEIERGDIYGIIGMSGAGKSTLVRCLNFLEVPTSGQVIVGGRDMASLSDYEMRKQRQDMAMIFQHFNLLMQKNVIDNVCFPLRIQGANKKEAKEKAMELLGIVGLADKAASYPAQLSGGQKQRVAIARALASDPKILLCDEATSALDPQTTASILELLKDINTKFGITMVIITHQMAVIREICHNVAILNHGVLVEDGRVEDIFNHPKSAAAKELILGDIAESQWNGSLRQQDLVNEDKRIRIVFTANSAFEPVIANMILQFGVPVNILKADTRNVGGIAKGEMILGLPKGEELQKEIEEYMRQKGLEIEEVQEDV